MLNGPEIAEMLRERRVPCRTVSGRSTPEPRAAVTPVRLPPNPIEHLYLGGDLIAALRGGPGGPNRPEEWLGSTTTRFGTVDDGLTVIDGVPLRDLIEAAPEDWLGAAHVERYGTSPALLVKLLHAGQRLPVHLHPSRSFAARHLDCPFGKSEAWLVLDRDRSDTTVYVGTNRPVERGRWEELMAAQDGDAMLELLNPVAVEPGDGVFVPAGSPHAIGEGLLVLELQEPTDFSILLEWEGFKFDGPNDGHLELGFDTALDAINPSAFAAERLDELIRRQGASGDRSTVRRTLPPTADPYFELHRLAPASASDDGESATLPRSFGVLLVTDGSGELVSAGGAGEVAISRGDAYVIPHVSGPVALTGDLTAYFATPPRPDTDPPIEFDS